ncbi:MAG: twin-arginine translocase subunit TatC [Candidatus Saccharibacteria bacterium]|nr:twin-arginine translocase subunit TatC [Candidatus Saccharibacteria bacterium]
MNSAHPSTIRKPFIEHVYEFRRRLLWCALFFAMGGVVGYALYDSLLLLIQEPLGQTLYFTSPTGGFNFVFKVCAAFGFVVALPMIVYQLLKFVAPVAKRDYRRAVFTYLVWSANLAYIGVLFGYLVSLPAALHFLTRFGGESIQALITADEYFNFALAYIVGFALLFQLPLIILFINKIKPLKPSGMMKAQRWVILVSFIVAAILTPTPDPMNQFIMAVPVILLYQISILMVWFLNRKKFTKATGKATEENVKNTPEPVAEYRAQIRQTGDVYSIPVRVAATSIIEKPRSPGSVSSRTKKSNVNGILDSKLLARSQRNKPLKQPVFGTFNRPVVAEPQGRLVDITMPSE